MNDVVFWNPPEAVRASMREDARAGDIDAMYILGVLLTRDPPDLDGALTWLTQAAKAGDPEAMTSLAALLTDKVDYEFRTTVVHPLHGKEELTEVAQWLQGAKRYYLQQFRPSEQVPNEALEAPSYQEMKEYLEAVRKILPIAELRGVD